MSWCSKKIHEICSPEIQSGDAFSPLLFSVLRILNSILSRPPPASTSLPNYSLFMRFSRACPLTSFLITYVRKFPSTLFRDLLDCLCPAVLTFHLTLEWLKLPTRTRAWEQKASSSCLKKSLPSEVHDRCCKMATLSFGSSPVPRQSALCPLCSVM